MDPATKTDAVSRVKYLARDGGRAFAGSGSTIMYKDEPGDNENRLFVFEMRFVAGMRVPPHTESDSETFYALEGTIEVTADGTVYQLNPGDMLHMKAGTLHAMYNPGPGVARFLAWTSP